MAKPCPHPPGALASCCPYCSIEAAVAIRRAVQSGERPPAPRPASAAVMAAQPAPVTGPGTELKRALDGFSLPVSAGCSCASLQAEMDGLGPAGCRQHIDRLAAAIAPNAVAAGLATDPADPDLLALIRLAIEYACQAAEAKALVPARPSGHAAGPNPPPIPDPFPAAALVTGGSGR